MEHRRLGRAGVKVSRLCFGTMSFGGDADDATSAALFARCRDAGINFFDTADTYTGGRSEEILGRLMAGGRDELIVATKFASPIRAGDVNARGGSRRHILQAVEASLRRLRTDRIDLYYAHFPDPETPLEETVRALDDLVRQGKVLYLGVSNFPAWQIATALGVAAREGLARFECVQPMYSLLKRQAEVELLPLAEYAGLAVCPYNAMAGGLLSGKYAGDGRPAGGRLLDNPRYRARYAEPWMPGAVDRFVAYARAHGHHPVSLAVAWVAAHPAVTAPLVGARTVA
ncbi:MAG: aldo/keto reductase, partial [Candidatus Rokuibacteriota bacterium]